MASYRRHKEHPPLAVRAVEMPAECYSHARLTHPHNSGEANPTRLNPVQPKAIARTRATGWTGEPELAEGS